MDARDGFPIPLLLQVGRMGSLMLLLGRPIVDGRQLRLLSCA